MFSSILPEDKPTAKLQKKIAALYKDSDKIFSEP